MNEMMAAMGWNPWTYHAFILANVAIFAAYGVLGFRHLQLHDDTLEHTQYGLFIAACGLGHLVMAAHMLIPMPWILTLSHVATAAISMWTATIYRDR